MFRWNTVQPDWSHMPIWRMRLAWWIIKATDTHSEYVILNAFPLEQWLHERTSLLRYGTRQVMLQLYPQNEDTVKFEIQVLRYRKSGKQIRYFNKFSHWAEPWSLLRAVREATQCFV